VANGLLTDLVEYWQPDVALGSLKGMVAGIDFNTDTNYTVANSSSYPSGKVLIFTGNGEAIVTNPDPLLSDIGHADFFFVYWSKLLSDIDYAAYLHYTLGEGNQNGFDVDTFPNPINAAAGVEFEIANLYPDLVVPSVYTLDTVHCVQHWYTIADTTLHTKVDGGMEFTLVSPAGAGAPDLTNYLQLRIQSSDDGDPQEAGECGLWRGTIPDADQRALLFGGLGFADFDAGGTPSPPSPGVGGGAGRRPMQMTIASPRRLEVPTPSNRRHGVRL
jgi:hypothetical protein